MRGGVVRKEGEDALLHETTPLSRCLDAEREFFLGIGCLRLLGKDGGDGYNEDISTFGER